MSVRDTRFARNVAALRDHHNMTRGALAARTGLSERQILDIERGRRRRVQEMTIRSLADAFGVTGDELIYGEFGPGGVLVTGRIVTAAKPSLDDRPHSKHRSWSTVAIGAAVIAVAILMVWGLAVRRAAVRIDGTTITVRDGVFGAVLWTRAHDSVVRVHEKAPWGHGSWLPWLDNRVLIYGLGGRGPDAGTVYAVRLRDGTVLWQDVIDPKGAAGALGPEYADAGVFWVMGVHFADLEGSGEPVAVVDRMHDHYSPACISFFHRDGSRLGTYYNHGHFYDVTAADLDADGKQEVLVCGTNNIVNSATVILLDDNHCSGVSTDPRNPSATTARDGSCLRIVMPPLEPEFVELLSINRLEALTARVYVDSAGDQMVNVDIGSGGESFFVVQFDNGLHPLTGSTTDTLVRYVRHWPPELRQRIMSKEWMDGWLAHYHRYGGNGGVAAGS
ncbi:MAG: helix-turn-helix transcriptional regulator [bacterium]